MPTGSGKFIIERRGRALGSVKLVWQERSQEFFPP